MATYYPTIGLEIHAQLKTATKMFCSSPNDPFDVAPNTHVCPVCMAHPGALPTINKKAVESVVRVGLALGADIANFTEFDRKNYFYPDIPKGYQISQYKHPIVSGGSLAGFNITRVHLEEDTGTNKHVGDETLVDFNRAGVPLMELVTEPVLHSAEDAMRFAKELQLLLRYLGVSEADMEKGQMRVEPNISISREEGTLGTKVEVKNINSFKAVGAAIAYEIDRMSKLFDEGRDDEIVQENRGWDENRQKTVPQRKKEDSHDYRYFPDPDLPKLYLEEIFDMKALRCELPELPEAKRVRYADDYGIKAEDIEAYVVDRELGTFFESVAGHLGGDATKIKKASNFITSDIVGYQKNKDIETKLPKAESFATLIDMLVGGDVSSRGAKEVIEILMTKGGDARTIAEKEGLLQESDEGALEELVMNVIAQNPEVADEYREGKENALKFLMGQVMKESKGSANPQIAVEFLKKNLS